MSVWVGVSGIGLLPGSMQPAWGKENTFLDTKRGSGMTLMGVTGVVGQAELRTWLMEVTETEGQTPAAEFPPCWLRNKRHDNHVAVISLMAIQAAAALTFLSSHSCTSSCVQYPFLWKHWALDVTSVSWCVFSLGISQKRWMKLMGSKQICFLQQHIFTHKYNSWAFSCPRLTNDSKKSLLLPVDRY